MRSNIKKYGSDEKKPWYTQDGIAPQVEVGGLNIIKKPTIGGRAYIPMDGKHDFIQSHLTSNYMWIFSLPSSGANSAGYINLVNS